MVFIHGMAITTSQIPASQVRVGDVLLRALARDNAVVFSTDVTSVSEYDGELYIGDDDCQLTYSHDEVVTILAFA